MDLVQPQHNGKDYDVSETYIATTPLMALQTVI
jgi:hypothetical protein